MVTFATQLGSSRNVTSVTGPDGNTTRFTYDRLNRQTHGARLAEQVK
jgi:YD repeat-containing protein